MTDQHAPDGIAIVGMAGRFPGAPDVDTLWANLCAGVESIRPLPVDELRASGAPLGDPSFVNAVGALDDLEAFDAAFFGMGRREAELTDPQHRIVLETVWSALEHAGYDPLTFAGRIGLFGGVAANQYHRRNLLSRPELLARAGFYPVLLASEREYAITRAAFKLGLRGPAVAVITACSTSAVATHLAVQSLLAGDSDLALAGGAHINLEGRHGYVYEEDSILSPDGHVRAFDADARGTVMASGVAFIALKRIEDALADGDTVYAVIRGSAVNNDGAARIGFTAPSTEGQSLVIEEALAVADVSAETIGLLESHGTGTSLGDPIEVEALTRAYRRHTDRRGYCALGSLKSNVGHLDAAAGAASIIKAALSLHHGRIPPSINFRAPNPQIDFETSPFFVNTELLEWERSDEPRRAGVSSFGFGGTNAHLVLEEAPATVAPPGPEPERPWILGLSAKTAEALGQQRLRLAAYLEAHPDVALGDAAHTLALGRARLPERAAVVAEDRLAAIELLREPDPARTAAHGAAVDGAGAAFLFTGQGAQYVGMGAGLYRGEPVFAEAMDECARLAGEIDGHDLIDLIYGPHADPDAAQRHLLQTAVGQPAIFALQFALARLWASWGIEPVAMVGHSVGEIAAACIGGVLSPEAAMRLAVARGRLMQELPVGAMTAVLADEATVRPHLDAATSMAAVNAGEQCVVAGKPEAIDELEGRLAASGVAFRRLPTDRAFHSAMMEPVLEPLEAAVDGIAGGALRIPLVSTVTGTWAGEGDLAEPGYWARHARQTVRFADAVGVLLRERPGTILLEVGPGTTLTSLARQHPDLPADAAVIATLAQRGAGPDDRLGARRALAEAWAAGANVDWPAVSGGYGRRVALPTYPFARDRFWIDEAGRSEPATPMAAISPAVTSPAAGAAEEPLGVPAADRRERIADQLRAILADLGGLDAGAIDPAASFTDLGFDSLFLTQVNTQLKKRFGVRVTLRQLLAETPTTEALAARIDSELPPDSPSVTPLTVSPGSDGNGHGPPEAAAVVMGRVQAAEGPGGGLRSFTDDVGLLIEEQLRIMERQLELLEAHVSGAGLGDGPGGRPVAAGPDAARPGDGP